MSRGAPLNRPVHVFNVDIKDNHEEAMVGSKAILDLANRLNVAAEEEWDSKGTELWEQGGGEARRCFDERVPEILAEWQEKYPNLPALWTLSCSRRALTTQSLHTTPRYQRPRSLDEHREKSGFVGHDLKVRVSPKA
ncbi:RNA polymerase II subunit A C-terminal domain phosphatase [Ascosphaera aggregata]|nr:RNA polymerase II subunit A C-terminal domain phosphatase [Ascosphaera aggregata]